MNKAAKMCKKTNCINAATESGYCLQHVQAQIAEEKNKFARLRTHTPAFYHTAQWTAKSKLYRQEHPVCERCLKNGSVRASKLVHHKIEVKEMLRLGLDPYDDNFLEALCHNCHQQDLAKKQSRKT